MVPCRFAVTASEQLSGLGPGDRLSLLGRYMLLQMFRRTVRECDRPRRARQACGHTLHPDRQPAAQVLLLTARALSCPSGRCPQGPCGNGHRVRAAVSARASRISRTANEDSGTSCFTPFFARSAGIVHSGATSFRLNSESAVSASSPIRWPVTNASCMAIAVARGMGDRPAFLCDGFMPMRAPQESFRECAILRF